MQDEGMRKKIHSTWNSFVPSVIWMFVYSISALLIIGFNPLSMINISIYADALSEFQRHKSYEILKDMNIVGAVPIFVVTILAIVIYLFDLAVFWLGSFIPPYLQFRGSSAPFVERHIVIELYSHLPAIENPAALDFEAQRIIQHAIAEGKVLPPSGLKHKEELAQSSWRAITYGKTAILWALIWCCAAFVFDNKFIIASIGWTFASISLFAAFTLYSIARQTLRYIDVAAEQMKLASLILSASGVQREFLTDQHELMIDSMDIYASRLIHLKWLPRSPLETRHKVALFGRKQANR